MFCQGGRMFGLPRIVVVLLAVYFAFFAWHSLGVARQFSPDSMNYVDVARHLRAGDGIVQTTIGFNEAWIDPAAEAPVPFVAQPPLYPLAVAALTSVGAITGMTEEDAALLLPALCYFVTLIAGAVFVRRLSSGAAGLFALGILVIHYPLAELSRYALTESMGLAFVLVSLALLVRPRTGASIAAAFASGLTAGLAFATRYALAPFAVVGLAVLAIRPRPPAHQESTTARPGRFARAALSPGAIRALIAYSIGASVPVAGVLAHNIAATGSLGPPKPAAFSHWYEGAGQFFVSLVPWLADPERIPLFSQALVLGIIAAILVRFAKKRAALAGGSERPAQRDGSTSPSVHRSITLLISSIAVYGIALVVVGATVRTTGIDPRLALPAAVLLLLLVAIVFVEEAKLTMRAATRIASGFLLIAILGTGVSIARGTTGAFDGSITSERREQMAWIEANAMPGDWIVGEDAVDFAFAMRRTRLFSYSEYPFTHRLTRETFDAIAARVAGSGDLYLVLRGHRGLDEEDWQWGYGEFIAELSNGEEARHPDLQRVFRGESGDSIFKFAGQPKRTTR